MKTKYTLLLIFISIFSFVVKAGTHEITETGSILWTTEYVDNCNETWNITSSVTDKPIKITYYTGTELNYDFVTIKSVDALGVATTLITLSGTKSGVISTMLPTGKAQITFTSDGSVCYASNPSLYSGLNISFAVDNDYVVNTNLHVSGNTQTNGNELVAGNLGIGTTTPTKKLEILEGVGGRFSFSAANCTSGYEVAQTIDNTGYKLNIGTTVRDYRIAINGSDKFAISTAGNIGIGTTSPTQLLDIEKNYDYQLRLGNTSGQGYNIGRNGSTGFLTFYGDQSGYNGYTFGGVNGTRMTINGSGNVGIGTTTPQSKLDVAGEISLTGRLGMYLSDPNQSFSYDSKTMGHYSLGWFNDSWCSSYGLALWMSGYGGVKFFTTGTARMVIDHDGKVGIGTLNPDALLTVNGTIHAKEVNVTVDIPADYVFKPTYKLMPLHQVEQYVKTNSHLPEIPSADEITKKGLSVGEMQNKLLQKIEELTLYVIEQQKQIEELKASLNPSKGGK